jgi:predicted nucleotidyltransferase
MVKTGTELNTIIKRYARTLERLGLPVERIILFGSYRRREAGEDSDIDLAVFSEAFGGPEHLELSGVLSEAKWNTEPMIQAIGFHPSVLKHPKSVSFLNEIIAAGQVVYRRSKSVKTEKGKNAGIGKAQAIEK